jgi:hypothetical protein
MPFKLEKYHDKAIVVNAVTGHHQSLNPIPMNKAKAQLRILNQIYSKEKHKKKM